MSESLDKIGDMDNKCKHCGAYKFKKETPIICCSSGKIQLPPFPEPPAEIYELWTEDTRKANLFRSNSRTFNNAICLSSIMVQEKTVDGYSPNVIFQGKVTHLMGPLHHETGSVPYFAQLYVLDPGDETTRRFNNMNVSRRVKTPWEFDMMKELLDIIQGVVHQHNPFVRDIRQLIEMPPEQLQSGKIVVSAKAQPRNARPRVYNHQVNLDELSIVKNEQRHDFVIHLREGGLRIIHDLNPKAMPLHFTLLFIHGTPGWGIDLKQNNNSNKRLSAREFFAFHMHTRNTRSDYIFSAGRLFQEWILNSWITVENQRLKYLYHNQQDLRADSYKNVKDFVDNRHRADSLFDDVQENGIGRQVLPSSFIGGFRWFQKMLQDAIAIVRFFYKPTLFVTLTCNPKWPEITSQLKPGQRVQDRPDLVARVFKLKKDQLMNDLLKGNIFGKIVAYLWVIEFQKRGLPHVHMLLILDKEDVPKTANEVDKMVCAELPPNPSEEGISQEEKAKRQPLWDIVVNTMIHGPCNADHCIKKGVCTKGFPKAFQKKTVLDEERSYPIYQRRSTQDGGQTGKKEMMINGKKPFITLTIVGWYLTIHI